MAKHREPAEEPISIDEQKAMLEGISDEGVPDYVVMEDEKPGQFNKLMSEGSPGEGNEMSGLMQAINSLPDRIMERLRDG